MPFPWGAVAAAGIGAVGSIFQGSHNDQLLMPPTKLKGNKLKRRLRDQKSGN